jgi:Protein of unknown function (DUF3592)
MGPKGVIGAGFVSVATLIFATSGMQLVDTTAIAWSGSQTTGTIIGHEPTDHRGGRRTIYSFKDASGRRFEGHVGAGFNGSGPNARARRTAEVGRSVTVFYDPADPSQSVMNTFWGRLSDLFVMLFVLPHMLVGIYLVRRDRKDEGWEPG